MITRPGQHTKKLWKMLLEIVDFPMKNGPFSIVFCMFTRGYMEMGKKTKKKHSTSWWYTYPSEKYESQLGLYYSQYMEKKMFQTTNQSKYPSNGNEFPALSRYFPNWNWPSDSMHPRTFFMAQDPLSVPHASRNLDAT